MKRIAIGVGGVLLLLTFVALGSWQVERLAWKRALIARVEARLRSVPVAAPATVTPDDAYRRVAATGMFLHGPDTFVQAVTVRGPGWWVLTPFRTDRIGIVLVNRGYSAVRAASPPTAGRVTVTGLLRLDEPGGGFLRDNDPAADRWYSRDVAAIARRRGLARVAPYFIDAITGMPGGPVAGLTVVRFTNNHLAYAVTWYALAAMTGFALIRWLWLNRRR